MALAPPALLATTIAGNQLLSMGPRADASGGPGSPVIYPASALWRQAKKQGGHGVVTHHPGQGGRWRRLCLVKALQNAGYDVISFDNGLSAYQRLREEPFELLLTDIVMPEMDGIELARRASELDPDIKIMFITGFAAVALNSDSAAPK